LHYAMTGEQLSATVFTTANYIIFLLCLLIGTFIFTMVQIKDRCRNKVKLIVIKTAGGGSTAYAPKEGSSVSLTKKGTTTTRMWPLNKLCTLDVPYPEIFPPFLQGTITQIWVYEEDFEPVLNLGSYTENVASPDVKAVLLAYAKEKNIPSLTALAEGLNVAPTRKMIASPAVLGNLLMEKVSEALITANKEMLDKISALMKRLDNVVSTSKFYIGIGVVTLAVVAVGYLVMGVKTLAEDNAKEIQIIENALGIQKVTSNTTNVAGK
jgi:hypothetical protein